MAGELPGWQLRLFVCDQPACLYNSDAAFPSHIRAIRPGSPASADFRDTCWRYFSYTPEHDDRLYVDDAGLFWYCDASLCTRTLFTRPFRCSTQVAAGLRYE